MNKLTVPLSIIILALGLVLGSTIQSKAQNKSFMGIIPFMTSSDRLGFFDQRDGKIFMYDNNFSKCLFIGQVGDLGQPIQQLAQN